MLGKRQYCLSSLSSSLLVSTSTLLLHNLSCLQTWTEDHQCPRSPFRPSMHHRDHLDTQPWRWTATELSFALSISESHHGSASFAALNCYHIVVSLDSHPLHSYWHSASSSMLTGHPCVFQAQALFHSLILILSRLLSCWSSKAFSIFWLQILSQIGILHTVLPMGWGSSFCVSQYFQMSSSECSLTLYFFHGLPLCHLT